MNIEPYEIGKRYTVPCVSMANNSHYLFRCGEVIPIIGPLHEDAAIIKFPHDHWHIDFRFLSKPMWERLARFHAIQVHGHVIKSCLTRGGVCMQRLHCKRAMPEFPTEIDAIRPAGYFKKPVPWLAEMQEAYKGCVIKSNCATCPHKGFQLAGLPSNNGVVVCPGHGLAWDVATGRMVKRA